MKAEFKKYLGTDMLAANVASFMRLRKNDWHYQGDVVVQSLKATKVVDNHNATRTRSARHNVPRPVRSRGRGSVRQDGQH